MVDKENYLSEMNVHLQRESPLLEIYADFFQDNEIPANTIAQSPVPNAPSVENSSPKEKEPIKIIIVPSSNESNQQMDLGQQEYYENCQEQANIGKSSNSLKMDIEDDKKGTEEDPKENSTENTTENSPKENQIPSQIQGIYIPIQKWDKVESGFSLLDDISDLNSDERLHEGVFHVECNRPSFGYLTFYEMEDTNLNNGAFMNNCDDETRFGTEGYPG